MAIHDFDMARFITGSDIVEVRVTTHTSYTLPLYFLDQTVMYH